MVDKSNHETQEKNDFERENCTNNAVTQLSGEWAEKAFQELRETPEAVEKGLAELKKLIAEDPNLNAKTDDAFLLRFLRAKKFDVPKSFFTLQRYYQMKYECPELFKVPHPSKKLHILDMQCQNLLRQRDNNGSRVYIFRVEKCDVSRVSVEDVFCTNVMALELAVREPETQVAGITAIVDMNGFGLQQHAKFLSPHYAKRTVDVVQETFPLRFKGFHVVNQPFYFDAVYSVLKPFLKEKIRKRIYLHGKDFKSLHNYVNKDILPLEYGGSEPFDNSHFKRSLLNLENEFSEMENYGFTSLPEKINERKYVDKINQDQ